MLKRLANPIKNEDDFGEAKIRPSLFDEFIGQEQAKSNLRIFVESAKKRDAALDHLLLHGPPGLGKTTIAQIISEEMGAGFKTTSGPILSKAGDLAAILTNIDPYDILFIDEIHRLNTAIEEVLYPAMEDFKLDLVIGEGPSARTVRIDLPPFTLVGATTRIGLLSAPLRDRFGIPVRLNFYEPEELELVINRAAKIINIAINHDGCREIAARSRGTPRIALRLLRRVRDFAIVAEKPLIDLEIASSSLEMLEVDEKGLDAGDMRYLRYIADHFFGGPVGIETIAAGLSEQKDSLEETIEPYLLQQGFIQRTPRGRVLTINAFAHLGLTPPKQNYEDQNLL